MTTNGIFRPFALVDGRAVATWGLAGGVVTLRPLERIRPADLTALRRDAHDVLRYLGLPDDRPGGGGLGGQAERGHPPGVVLGEAGEHPAHLGQVGAAVRHAADEQGGQRVALGGHPLRLAERLADQAAPPQRQPAGQPGVGLDRRPHPVDREGRVAGVLEHPQHEVAGRVVQVGRDLAVEVRRDAVADVGLDQALEPVPRGGALVERLQRRR